MRVIAGEFRRRILKSVPGLEVRPTPDRLREALFNILTPVINEAMFVDAYAGSGAVGIEALSRGARQVVLIERNGAALGVIRENLSALGIQNRVNVVRGKASVLLPQHPGDIVFLDPPYELVDEYRDSLNVLAGMNCPLVIAQHSTRLKLEDRYGSLARARVLKQGDNSLSFFEQQVNVHDVRAGGPSLDQIS
jgi:16S rRNA (guanine966-N2)-methyltransferase